MEQAPYTVNKSAWPLGPWSNEPDKMQWQDPATGLACLVVRNSGQGFLCGYVGVPPGHKMYGINYGDVDADVHGDLTYASACHAHICHIPESGEPDNVWWLGFDCGHSGDAMPNSGPFSFLFGAHNTYRDLAYVKAECTRLAAQLAMLA